MTDEKRYRNFYLPEDEEYRGGNLLHNIVLFGQVCHALGMDVTPNSLMDIGHALEYIDLSIKADVYNTLKTLIVTRHRDIELFDEAFKLFWQAHSDDWATIDLTALGPQRLKKKGPQLPSLGAPPDEDEDSSRKNRQNVEDNIVLLIPTVSDQEVLRHKNFSEMTGEELEQAKRMMEKMRWSLGTKKTRRLVLSGDEHIDPRQMFRENMKYTGEPIEFPTRGPKVKPRPLVIIADISGSMERYTRLLLHFMHTLSQSIYRVESFVYSTHLTRITLDVRRKSVDKALFEVGQRVSDWAGGTRTDEALHTFNYRWARRVLGQGAVVMLITDGWDRGDPDLLAASAARLHRNCYRFIWLNPLLGSERYEPLTRGAQSILPFIDDFLPVHNLASLEHLAKELSRVNWQRSESKTLFEKFGHSTSGELQHQ